MLNRAIIVGRLTRDPDLRYTQSGIAVANFTVAANRPFKNAQGEQEADFISCVIWRKAAESLANYQKKGNLIGLEGRIQTSTYQDNDGKTVYKTEVLAESVQFLDPKSNNSAQGQNKANTDGNGQGNTNTSNDTQGNQNAGKNNEGDPFASEGAGREIDIQDDDLPFNQQKGRG